MGKGIMGPNKHGALIPNNQGLVVATTGNDNFHLLSTGRNAKLRKFMWSNNAGANATIRIGTMDNAGVFVPMLPTITAINGFDGELKETEIPDAIWAVDVRAGANGRTGDIIVVASVAGVLTAGTIEER